jgi:ribosomal protein S19
LKTKIKPTKKLLFIFKKNSIIPVELNNQFIKVYKGNNFRPLKINLYNIGFKFGNFTLTRKPFNYPLKAKKKNIITKR